MKLDWVTTDCTNVHVWQFERKSRGEINFIVMNMIQEIPQKFFLHWNSQNWWRYQILISMVFFYNAKFCFDVVVLRSEAYVCIFLKKIIILEFLMLPFIFLSSSTSHWQRANVYVKICKNILLFFTYHHHHSTVIIQM